MKTYFFIEEILPENDLVVLLYDIMQLVMQKSQQAEKWQKSQPACRDSAESKIYILYLVLKQKWIVG